MVAPWAAALAHAQAHALAARYSECTRACEDIVARFGSEVESWLDVGSLLLNWGYLSDARRCFKAATALAPDDLRAYANLANLERDAGDHVQSRKLYEMLLAQYPNHPVIRRNAVVSLEYDPAVTDAQRLAQATAWGTWAYGQAVFTKPRPALLQLEGRPLRVGYVSADFCQHTVGIFVKNVLMTHEPSRVMAFAYSAGHVSDWITAAIRATCQFRDVAALSDAALAALIRKDRIDLLVDLSGHTAGSRLAVFALRPAPVQVSWLGYFATTGLSCMDAVMLDKWHAPPGTEAQFVERVVRLPAGRFCYQPLPWTPDDVALPPCLRRGVVTFGCFNNTAKLNTGVLDAWAKILAAVPASRLVLKWRTFADESLRASVQREFAARGVETARLELRGESFHVDMLGEYSGIDIALDPFPFTGGLTSCEALWMGVPVVTWPQSRVVSRQTLAILSAIGLPELAATSAGDYVRIAVELAADPKRLAILRTGMRARMRASPLMDIPGFTRQLEQALIDIYQNIAAGVQQGSAVVRKTVLHVGPGHRQSGAALPPAFQAPDWQELRLDIDPANEPDILGSMLDMASVPDASVDAVYSAHNIEHVYPHEVALVLQEFHRVLKSDGFLVVTCPDLQAVCAMVVQDRLTDAAYQSLAGPITPLDILYGHGAALAAGHHYMAHKGGFTLKTLTQALQVARFRAIAGKRRSRGLDLWVVATRADTTEEGLRKLAAQMLPDESAQGHSAKIDPEQTS